jgi:hypothetical protein
VSDIVSAKFLTELCKGLHHYIEYENYTGKSKLLSEKDLRKPLFEIISRESLGKRDIFPEEKHPLLEGNKKCDLMIKHNENKSWFELKYIKSKSKRIDDELRRELLRLINGVDNGRRFLLVLTSTDIADKQLTTKRKTQRQSKENFLNRGFLDWPKPIPKPPIEMQDFDREMCELLRNNSSPDFTKHRFSELKFGESPRFSTIIKYKSKSRKIGIKDNISLDEYKSKLIYSRRRTNTTLFCWEISIEGCDNNLRFPQF